jgi:hypothetical protein
MDISERPDSGSRRWRSALLVALLAVAATSAACGASTGSTGSTASPRGTVQAPAVAPAGASATATWTIAPSPTPAGALSAQLSSVSCPTTSYCLAVGGNGGAGRSGPLAESWDGRDWRIADSDGLPGSLLAVSCTSATACMAVGGDPDAVIDGAPYSALWNGRRWRVLAVPTPPGVGATLASISCPSPTTCLAVGAHRISSRNGLVIDVALAEIWDGRRWTVSPAPSVAGPGELVGISCPTVTFCVAVGLRGTPAANFEDTWDGRRWTASPLPGGADTIFGVACTSPQSCIAVGSRWTSTGDQAGEQTFAERFDGKSWSVQPMPLAPGPGEHRLQAVSCWSPQACVAVGIQGSGNGPSAPLADSWDGRAWTVDTTPTPPPVDVQFPATAETVPPANFNSLEGVACLGALRCIAVGAHVGEPDTAATLVEVSRSAPAA